MAKKKAAKNSVTRKAAKRPQSRAQPSAPRASSSAAAAEPEYDTDQYGIETTGRSIVTFSDSSAATAKSSLAALKASAGISSVCSTADFSTSNFSFEAAQGSDAVVFNELGIAIITGDGDRQMAMASMSAADSSDSGMIVEAETINYGLDEGFDGDAFDPEPGDEDPAAEEAVGAYADYLRGYKDGVGNLADAIAGGTAAGVSAAGAVGAAAVFDDNAATTWGLQATRVLVSQATGRGINVAILDTGMDLRHPDFAGRTIQSQSFIPGEAVQDRNGHGTHCIGTSCGPKRAGIGPRYDIAYEANIFAGKVLSNAGSGSDGGILGGINWAVQNRCAVISMSLGRPTRPGERPMAAYENAGRRAIQAGSLIIAAAGNSSARPTVINPVGSPANASLIAAVAAIDNNLRIARFSDGGINPGGGEVNFAGPGVNVRSSWPMPLRYRTISGTSMATPHLAGIAALIAQQNSAFRGIALYREIQRRVRRLPLARRDVGNGLGEAV